LKNYLLNIFVALIVTLTFTTCSQTTNNNNNVFYINQNTGIENLDPAFSKSLYTMWHANQMFNRLLETDSNLKIAPSLAKSYTISADRKQYVFNLRTDVYFQDNEIFMNGKGRKMIAQDVAYSFTRIIDAATSSPGAWIFNGKVDSLQPFVALNDSTFQLNLIQPFNPILNILTMQYCSIVPYEGIEKWGKDFRAHPVGTGPFMLEYWDEGNVLVEAKNKNYWEHDAQGVRLPYLDALKFTFVDSKASEFLMFMQGKIDFMNGVDASFKDQILTKQGALKTEYQNKMVLKKGPYCNVEYIGILNDNNNNNAFPILKNKAIRNAINKGFDKQKLVTYLRNNIGTPANSGMIPKGLLGFDSVQQKISLYSTTEAKKLLSNIYKSEKLKVQVPDMYEDRCSFMSNQLQDIGLTIDVEQMQQSLLRESISDSKLGMFWATWIADYADAECYLAMFYSKNGAPPNYSRFKNDAYDKLYEQCLQVQDEKQKENLYKAMDKIIREEAPVIPLFYDEVLNFIQPNVQGWKTNALNVISLKKVRKDKSILKH
jgi:oligopeptide transport system substrate-binding protein